MKQHKRSVKHVKLPIRPKLVGLLGTFHSIVLGLEPKADVAMLEQSGLDPQASPME